MKRAIRFHAGRTSTLGRRALLYIGKAQFLLSRSGSASSVATSFPSLIGWRELPLVLLVRLLIQSANCNRSFLSRN